MMFVEPAWGDCHNVRLLFVEQLPVVDIRFVDLQPLGGRGEASLVVVGDSYDLNVRKLTPDRIESVTVIAVSGARFVTE